MVMEDLNAKIGNNNPIKEVVVGKFGVGIINNTKERKWGVFSVNGVIVTG